MWEELMAIKEKGDEVAYRAALLDTLQRFMHKGQLVKAEGIMGLFAGSTGRFMYLGPGFAIWLPTYDLLKQLMGKS